MKNTLYGILLCSILLAGCATTSTLTIKTDPPGANIYVDGKSIGQTPATIKVKFAQNAQMVTEKKILVVKLAGYREKKEIISLEGTSQKTLEFLLMPALKKSTTQVVSKTTTSVIKTTQIAKETKSVRH